MSVDETTDSPAPDGVAATPEVAETPERRIPSPSQSQMQRWWQESISKSLGANGYKNVAVLVIKWQDDLDQLRVDGEVSDLISVFADKFGYATQTVELSLRNPQMQLMNAITGFIVEYDDPQNLLIVYYAGHGIFHDDGKLLEIANTDDPEADDMLSKAFWNEVQKVLSDHTAGDVLAIMDCCFASNLMMRGHQKVNSRAFEMLAASTIDKMTEAPGEKSFTRALIKCLALLSEREEGFDTHELSQAIDTVRTRTTCRLWNVLLGNRRHIRLGPRRTPEEDKDEQPPEPVWTFEAPGGLLSLQFVIKENELGREQIERLTQRLPAAFEESKVQLRNIRWLDFNRPKTFTGLTQIMQNAKRLYNRRKTLMGDAMALESLDSAEKNMKRKADGPPLAAKALLRKKLASSDNQTSGDESSC